MVRKKILENLWPISVKHLGKELLRALDDETFKRLKSLIFRREVANSGSERHARNIIRALDRRRRPYNYTFRSPALLAAQCKSSDILDSLCDDRKERWIATNRRNKTADITLKEFSFIDNPIETIQKLREIAFCETDCHSVIVNFADQEMLDIGPYLVWGIMRERMAPCIMGGSIFDGVRAAIEATGLRTFLKMGLYGRKGHERKIEPFRLRRRRAPGTSMSSKIALEPSSKEKTSDDLVSSINVWLKQNNSELTTYGRNQIAQLCGEILDNAERHARPGGDGDWAVAGLMERRNIKEENDLGKVKTRMFCNFAFINSGLTISETITNAEDLQTRNDVTRYVSKHSTKSDAARRDLLATIFALQDGVSRVSQVSGEKGGVGMMTAVEAVAGLGDTSNERQLAAVSIISGHSCILLTAPFLQPNVSDNLRFQWLNAAGSPNDPPNSSHAFSLPVAFPGTIISCRFVLNYRTTQGSVHGS